MTRIVKALVTTSRVNTWLETSQSARILHIFDCACNLINENQEVLSVVTPEIGNGPFNLVVESDIRFTADIGLKSPVLSRLSELRIGSLIIQAQDTQLWDSQPDWKALHTEQRSIFRYIKKLATNHQQVFPSHPPAAASQFFTSLSSSLAIADLPSSISAAKRLAGLGPGLTPSGDDYIMGALYATRIIHPQDVAERLTRGIADTASPRTTSLSGAWLRAAAKGEAGILWHSFFESLAGGEKRVIQKNISDLLSVGATSGADALAGFIDTLISFTALERKHVVSKVL